MKKLSLSDSLEANADVLLEEFYPSPGEIQKTLKAAYKEILKQKHSYTNFSGLFDTLLNRFLFVDVKLGEIPLLLKNLQNYLRRESVQELDLVLHKNNKTLGQYIENQLKEPGVHISIRFHKSTNYWHNALSRNFKQEWKMFCLRNMLYLVQLGALSLNFISIWKRNFFNKKKILHWNGFANNRESVDYVLLNKWEQSQLDYFVFYPDPKSFFNKANWHKSIYALGKYSPTPLEFIQHICSIYGLEKRIRLQLKKHESILGPLPTNLSQVTLTRIGTLLTYNFLQAAMLEKITRNSHLILNNVFRGGASAGLVFSGIIKKRYPRSKVHNLLVPHGTEFKPIDHFSYFYLDYNILPSQYILATWTQILNEEHSDIKAYNQSQLLAGGRIDYEYLKANTRALKQSKDATKLAIGMPLTYNTRDFNLKLIDDIVRALDRKYQGQYHLYVKPRPNLREDPSIYSAKYSNVKIFNQNIYHFLGKMDFIIGTSSTYGVLTMVVSDAIYLDIAAIYYLPQKNVSTSSLGYSFSDSMLPYSFFSYENLTDYFAKFSNTNDLLRHTRNLNTKTKLELAYEASPTETLEKILFR